MKPPCNMPSKARHARKLLRPDSQYWLAATMDQSIICIGIQRSGPTHLLTSCEGSSAHRKLSLNTVLPRLKSLVVRPRSLRKLSVLACWMLARSSSSAMKQKQVKIRMRASIFRMSLCSSPQVHLAEGLNRCRFSLLSLVVPMV